MIVQELRPLVGARGSRYSSFVLFAFFVAHKIGILES